MVKKNTKLFLIILLIIGILVILYIYQNYKIVDKYDDNNETNNHLVQLSKNNTRTPNTNTNIKLIIETPPPQIHQSPPQIHHQTAFPPTYTEDVINPNTQNLSYWNYTNRNAIERVINPILPPERSYNQVYGVPVNVPTRGLPGGFQQVGLVYKDAIENPEKIPGNNTDSKILALYGRPVDTSRNKWSYYVSGDGFQSVKIPISFKGRKCDNEFGCEEISNSDTLKLPSMNGEFKAEIYDYDKPRYIPTVW